MREYLRNLAADVTGQSFRIAALLGLASLPVALALSWLSFLVDSAVLDALPAVPIVATWMLVGVLYRKRPADTYRAGAVAGAVVGSLGGAVEVVLELLSWLEFVPELVATGESVAITVTIGVAGIVFAPLAFLVGIVVAAVIGELSAGIGQWMAEKTSRLLPRPTTP